MLPRRPSVADEARLLQRITDAYHKQLSGLIERMNHLGPQGGGEAAVRVKDDCIRACVEVVDVVLTSQGILARLITEMETEPRQMRARAA